MVLKPGYDWFDLYYRDRALCLQLGRDPLRDVPPVGRGPGRSGLGRTADAGPLGLQAAEHHLQVFVHRAPSSSMRSAPRRAAGARAVIPELAGQGRLRARRDRAYVSGGEGQTSEGEFWEALSSACNLKLPVLFLIEDNGYAISVPVEVNTPGGSISKLVRSFPNLFLAEVDGTRLSRVLRRAALRGRVLPRAHGAGSRPRPRHPPLQPLALRRRGELPPQGGARAGRSSAIRSRRLCPVSSRGGDPLRGRPREAEGEVDAEVNEAADRALAAALPEPESAYEFVYSPDVDPTSAAFATRAGVRRGRARRRRWSTS